MDKVISGRQEHDIKIDRQIMHRLDDLPKIFTEYYNDMQGDRKSYVTMQQYIRRVENFARTICGEKISGNFYADIKVSDIKAYLLKASGEDSAAIDWSALNSFYQFLVMNQYTDKNLMLSIKRPKINKEYRVTYLTEDEISEVLSEIEKKADKMHRNRDMAIISLFLATGLRSNALAQIDLADLDTEHRIIKVVEKGRKTRIIEYGESMDIILQNWLDDRKKYYSDADTQALFVTQLRKRINYQGINNIVSKYTEGIDKHITPHKLRSTAATSLAAQGTSIQTIKEVLGHSNVQTTMRYVTAVQAEKKQAVNTLDSLLANHERRSE